MLVFGHGPVTTFIHIQFTFIQTKGFGLLAKENQQE